MLDRKLILRALLIALGTAAVTGALGMLLGGNEVVLRVTWTAFITALSCGFMLRLVSMIDQARTRLAGMIGIVAVVVEFLLALAQTWLPSMLKSGRWDVTAAIVWTMVTIAGAAPLLIGFARFLDNKSARVASRAGMIVVAVGAAITLFACWLQPVTGMPDASWWSERLWVSALAEIGLGILAVAALVGVEATRRHWRWLGVAAAVVALVMCLIGIWGNPTGREELLIVTISIAAVVAHANIVLYCPLKENQRWLAWTTIGAGIFVAVTLDWGVLIRSHGEVAHRFSAAAAIVAGCGSVALLVLARLNRAVNVETGPTTLVDIHLACPRCKKQQVMPLGKSECVSCGLRVEINVEEPRCVKCGYLLYMLKSDNCPECGTPVTDASAKIPSPA